MSDTYKCMVMLSKGQYASLINNAANTNTNQSGALQIRQLNNLDVHEGGKVTIRNDDKITGQRKNPLSPPLSSDSGGGGGGGNGGGNGGDTSQIPPTVSPSNLSQPANQTIYSTTGPNNVAITKAAGIQTLQPPPTSITATNPQYNSSTGFGNQPVPIASTDQQTDSYRNNSVQTDPIVMSNAETAARSSENTDGHSTQTDPVSPVMLDNFGTSMAGNHSAQTDPASPVSLSNFGTSMHIPSNDFTTQTTPPSNTDVTAQTNLQHTVPSQTNAPPMRDSATFITPARDMSTSSYTVPTNSTASQAEEKYSLTPSHWQQDFENHTERKFLHASGITPLPQPHITSDSGHSDRLSNSPISSLSSGSPSVQASPINNNNTTPAPIEISAPSIRSPWLKMTDKLTEDFRRGLFDDEITPPNSPPPVHRVTTPSTILPDSSPRLTGGPPISIQVPAPVELFERNNMPYIATRERSRSPQSYRPTDVVPSIRSRPVKRKPDNSSNNSSAKKKNNKKTTVATKKNYTRRKSTHKTVTRGRSRSPQTYHRPTNIEHSIRSRPVKRKGSDNANSVSNNKNAKKKSEYTRRKSSHKTVTRGRSRSPQPYHRPTDNEPSIRSRPVKRKGSDNIDSVNNSRNTKKKTISASKFVRVPPGKKTGTPKNTSNDIIMNDEPNRGKKRKHVKATAALSRRSKDPKMAKTDFPLWQMRPNKS